MVKVKKGPIEDELELRYREDPPEIDNNVQYYQVGSVSDQIRAIWSEEEVEVKPKVEPIEFDPNRQVVIKLDRDFLRKNYRAKWIDHVLSTYRHRNFMKACQVCRLKNIFDSPAKLIEHYKEFHQKEVTWYKCAVCCYRTKRQEGIAHHWERQEHYGSRRKSSTATKYTVLRRPIEPNDIWIGDDELVHSMFYKEPLKCDICSKEFFSQYSFENHKIVYHLKENEIKKWYKCDQCDKKFRVKYNLKSHYRKVHEEKVSCVFCSKQYIDRRRLREHELKHRNEMLTCEFCDMKFITREAQCIHYRKLHFGQLRKQDKLNGGLNKWFQGYRIFECYRCRFTGKFGKVRNHMAKTCKFQGNNPIDCTDENCIRRFDTMHFMKIHYKQTHDKTLDLMNIRTSRRTYECYICQYTENGFNLLLLRKHLTKEHTIEDRCDICNATFSIWHRLERHKQIHGEKTFKCKYCPKLFQKAGLYYHEKTHTKPIKCESCDFRCATKESLRNHIQKHCAGKKMKKNVK